MYESILEQIDRDSDLPERAWTMDVRKRVLDGRLYDVLPNHFHEEWTDSGEYIPIATRRPSVRYNLCRTVVEESAALLFGEGYFPLIYSPDEETRNTFAALVKESLLVETMECAALRGSVGSVALLFRVLRDRPFFDVMETQYLTPTWDPEAPDTLQRVTEQYKVRGRDLAELGYKIPENKLGEMFWFRRYWDAQAETWFHPWPVLREDPNKPPPVPQVDESRSVHHGLGFVPIVWVRNLPGGDKVDGACTYEPAIPIQVEIDYHLSQAGRGLRYSSDPLLMIREPAGSDDKNLVRSSSNALIVNEKGDAKMLEISGDASAAVISYARQLREMALEQIHGNRASADRLTAAQTGRALELLHQPLVWLADRLRTSYGEGALISLMKMVVRASQGKPLVIDGNRVTLATDPITLRWKGWFPPTETDKQNMATTVQILRNSGHVSRETAVTHVASVFDIEDIPAEIAKIEADEGEQDSREIKLAKAGVKASAVENVPGR